MNRRELIKATAAISVAGAASAGQAAGAGTTVEQWGVFELSFPGPSTGNPFLDVQIQADFTLGHRTVRIPGFYDGNGVYRIRFMPDMPGKWSFVTRSNAPKLNGKSGAFEATAPARDNHGPVQVAHQFHFAHADGTPYFPFGTTCYALGFIGQPFEDQTFEGMKAAGFNKVRLCLLPKPLGKMQLAAMPFEHSANSPTSDRDALADGGKSQQSFDTARFNPAYFQQFDRVVQRLNAGNIQADVILFHPYDAWGFDAMPAAADDLYLRYVIARLSAYRNVWWAVANEYDLLPAKKMSDWDRFFRIIQESDPYGHLRSIHHSRVVYDHSKPWATHASLQQFDFQNAAQLRNAWKKPLVYDEIQYEGNIPSRWGNLTAEEMTHRFWLATVHGSYASHGETFVTPPDEPVWTNAGKLRGKSGARIGFLRRLMERAAGTGLTEFENAYYPCAGKANATYLYYLDYHAPVEYDFPLPLGIRFRATVIDPYEMTANAQAGDITATPKTGAAAQGVARLALPGKPYMAVLFEAVSS